MSYLGNQYLQNPNLQLKEAQIFLIFYTSDNSGEYEISLEGFTQEGKPVSVSEFFVVE